MIKPITPEEIGAYKAKVFPPEVIESVNELIAEKFSGTTAVIKQKDIVKRILEKMNGDIPEDSYLIKRNEVFDRGWLNFEEIYRSNGWSVTYDKPAYYENYDANFTFEVE